VSDHEEQSEGAGPFTTRVTWHPRAGGTAVWESRAARRRGAFRVQAPGEEHGTTQRADRSALDRLRRLNAIAAVAFVCGGLAFAAGAGVAQFGSGKPNVSASIYFAGGLFFNTGGYASLLQAINAPRRDSATDTLVSPRWRWWSYEPMRIDWLGTFLLFTGTLVFGVNLVDSFLQGLSIHQVNRLVWGPDIIGCVLFLVSGHLALAEISHGRPRIQARSLGWWIVAVNQIGSVLFLVSALGSYTRPSTGHLVNVDIANWGTLTGALCFSLGGVLQAFERP
jgi:hypothetical protein